MSAISFNTDSLKKKLRSHLSSAEGRKKIQDAGKSVLLSGRDGNGKSIHTPEEAADKFVEVLRKSIEGSGLSEHAKDEISDIDYTSAHQNTDGSYTICVYFKGDMSRESLDAGRYDDINDIVLLLNDGVDHRMNAVHGEWHGKEIWSRTVIPATQFLEQAIIDFMGNYGSEYGVTDIKIERK